MLLTIALALETNPEQRNILLETIEAFNSACNYLVSLGEYTNKYELQRIAYREVREKYGLSAQMAIRAISKVVEAWKTRPESPPVFELRGAVPYDQRILSFKGLDSVSKASIKGRLKLSLLMGGYQRDKLEGRRVRGQVDLIYRDVRLFLYVVVDAPEDNPFQPKDIGVDLGVVNIATDSTGRNWSSEKVEEARKRYERLRSVLQSVGTKSAKKHLKKLSGRERRFKRDVNHRISKALVGYAKGTSSAIALEDLKGIRKRTTVRRGQRSRHSKWAFLELRRFIGYKAKLQGVPVIIVDPKNTSRECPSCHYMDKGNRPTRDVFRCLKCGYTAPADYVGALNIRARAAVSQPIVAVSGAASSELLARSS
ncbi:MAG: transposase [TACK group archaeon]|nr:transposase [TACK group archaeon]